MVSSGLSKRGLVGLERSGSTEAHVSNTSLSWPIEEYLPMTLPFASLCWASLSELRVECSVKLRTVFRSTLAPVTPPTLSSVSSWRAMIVVDAVQSSEQILETIEAGIIVPAGCASLIAALGLALLLDL